MRCPHCDGTRIKRARNLFEAVCQECKWTWGLTPLGDPDLQQITLYSREVNSTWWFSRQTMTDFCNPETLIVTLIRSSVYEKVFKVFHHQFGQRINPKGFMSATAQVTRYKIPVGTYICEVDLMEGLNMYIHVVLNRRKENEVLNGGV